MLRCFNSGDDMNNSTNSTYKEVTIAQYLGVSVEALAGVDPEAPKEEVVESLSFVCPHCGNSVTIKVTK